MLIFFLSIEVIAVLEFDKCLAAVSTPTDALRLVSIVADSHHATGLVLDSPRFFATFRRVIAY